MPASAAEIVKVSDSVQYGFSVVRSLDLRPVDFASGKRLAISTEEMAECECCGRRIVRVDVLRNGLRVGSECSGYLSQPVYRMGRRNRKADALLVAAEAARA